MRHVFTLVPAVLVFSAFMGCSDAGVQPVFETPMYVKGYTYTSFARDGFARGSAGSAVTDLRAQTASTWIALAVFEFQSDRSASDIAPNSTGINPVTGGAWYETSDTDDLRTAVRDARAHGMRIMLKPQLDCYSGEWRALIRPDRDGKWFAAYEAMLLRYAAVAREEQIDMLCIGTELVTATQPAYTSRWKSMIAHVRTVFPGMLTYSSNWSGVASPVGEYEQIGFWDALDYIGVSAYFPLAASPLEMRPSESDAEARLHAHGMRLSACAVRWGKQILLTEAGCQSAAGALFQPADYTLGASASAVPDNAAQAFYYARVLNYFGNRPWCAGMFWWNWESVPGAQEATAYTCRNKPAAAILKRFYEEGASRDFFALLR